MPAESAENEQTHAAEPMRRSAPGLGGSSLALILATSLGLAAAADVLFLRQSVGWTAGGFLLLAMGVLLLTQPAALRSRPGRRLAVLLGGIVVALVVHPSPQAVLLASMGIVAFALVARQGWTTHVASWAERFVTFAVLGLRQPFRDLHAVRRWQREGGASRWAWKPVAWVVPLALGLVFLGFFAIANPVIAAWTQSAVEGVDAWLASLDAGRVGLWILVAWAAWALQRTRVVPGRVPRSRAAEARALLTDGVILRCLLVFNALFLLQNVLDCRYLWLGGALPEGMTYAQYAHRGAYPLVATALLAAGFVLATFRVGARPSPWARRLVFLWLAQNVLLTAFAASRLALYVEAFSLTRLRLAAGVWMGLVVCGLVLIAVRILCSKSNRWLVGANAVAAIAVVYVGCFLDLPRFIAHYNVARCEELGGPGKAIDMRYMEVLGASALPAYERLAREADDPKLRDQARTRAALLRAELRSQTATWRGWSLRRELLLSSDDR